MLKRIEMRAGTKGGLQYHRFRDEGGVVISGELVVHGLDLNLPRHCGPGDTFVFPKGSVHRIRAVTNCVYIEASTPFLNDRVRVDNEPGGLPSTNPEDVIAL
jgi:mannose-6-phosphate isomerase